LIVHCVEFGAHLTILNSGGIKPMLTYSKAGYRPVQFPVNSERRGLISLSVI
jgi:hypothetical protein